MANPVVGVCVCPLCGEDGAEVRQGIKGAVYIVCDACVSQVRTMSRQGARLIQALAGAGGIKPEPKQDKPSEEGARPAGDALPAAAEPEPKPEPKTAQKAKTVTELWGVPL
ncbi:MAG: hypothetical protein EG825_10320 [Rhodocyclaceae bacterium]|nr:hypothetical protein [Rhodocyclaceae bacterium]